MTILEFKRHFKEDISDLYTESESAFMFTQLVYKIVGFDHFQQRKFSNQELLKDDELQLENFLQELKTGKPFQHLMGETEFYGLIFEVNEHALIPRPETEELLEIAILEISNLQSQNTNLKILDIGTGSGIIPIVLKKHFPNAEVTSIDISKEALALAKKNSETHQTEIQFINADYLNHYFQQKFDVIISNPPYIGQDENEEILSGVKNFEPNIALFSPTNDALIFYRKIASDAATILNEKGLIFLEINQKLGQETLALYSEFPNSKLIKDLSGNDRFVVVRKD